MGDVLIVDGNPQRAMQAVQLMRDLNANACITGSVVDCLKHLEAQKPDLALVAEELPDGQGVQLLPAFDGLCPVVIVGEYMVSDRILETLSLGARDFLVHPLDQQVLNTPSATAAQLSATNAPDLPDARWISRAINSFPVPLSP